MAGSSHKLSPRVMEAGEPFRHLPKLVHHFLSSPRRLDSESYALISYDVTICERIVD